MRHNEEQLNSQLAQQLPLQVGPQSYDSAHTKTHLLLQAHFSHAPLPCSDYASDTKTVLDNAIRLCQVHACTRPHTHTHTQGGARLSDAVVVAKAMLYVAANQGWLVTAISVCNLVQMVVQGAWLQHSPLQTLPHVEQHHLPLFR